MSWLKSAVLSKADNFIKNLPNGYFHELEKAEQVFQVVNYRIRYYKKLYPKTNYDFR